MGVGFIALVGGQADSLSTRKGRFPKVICIDKDNLGIGHRGLTEQPGSLGVQRDTCYEQDKTPNIFHEFTG